MRTRKKFSLYATLAVLAIMIAAAVGLLWYKAQQTEPMSQPKSLVTTINGDAHTSRSFTWYTDNPNMATVLQLVKGAEVTSFDGSTHVQTVIGSTTTIETGKGQAQGVHKVTVTKLEPGTEYSYRVGSGEDKGWSAPAQFLTEAVGVPAFTFLNVTDSQGVAEADFTLWGQTLDQAFTKFPNARFLVHNGDLTEEPEDEKAWDAFFGKTQHWLTRIPLMPVTGNHDEVDGKADRYTAHFNLPDNGAKGSIPGTTYSFDYGAAHIAVLNTESNIDKQTAWLRKDLANTDKPWKIVAMHRGAYGGNSYKKVDKWVEVFDEFQVDLVLQGHNHEYSRSYPLRKGKKTGDGEGITTNRQGTVYVVTNTAGPKFNDKKEDQFYHKVHFQNNKQMFAGVTIEGDTLTYRAYDVTGMKLDEFALKH
ncbi:metallophosphoesterase [Paenibacillus sp. LMG 31456]|uniref:Metallophosphoesterase n=1 Tax=Paenibacillus foliorum TaxID=2654974 RepID=A0A972GUV5_9BACL|nr:metallophosphoesterase family protein [Paenibacillus foliorum]NOU94638.1 metallophosphoesterase [Paenibacillus foliorum]